MEQPSSGIPARMPDDDHRFSASRPDPERIDLAAIKTDLEFAIDQISRLHTQLARTALGMLPGVGHHSRAIIPGDDPGDQQPPERAIIKRQRDPHVARWRIEYS